MRILLIHNYYSQRGGEDTYFDGLIKLLKSNGHDVKVYAKHSDEVAGVKGRFSALKSMFAINRQVTKEISESIESNRPDIVHINNVFPLIGPSVYEVCHRFKIPIIQTVHNYRMIPDKEELLGYDNYRSNTYKKIFRASMHWAIKKGYLNLVDCFVFPTDFSRRVYVSNARFKINSSVVIPHFVNIGPARTSKKSDYFIYVGRFSKEKGILPLLDIFSEMPGRRLFVFGDGPQKKYVYEYGRFANIKILSWTDRTTLFGYIKKAVALISPSLSHEVMPMSVIESLSLKTRVIVPDKPVFKEIASRPDAVFYKDGDFDDLRKKIVNFGLGKSITRDYSNLYSPKKHHRSLMRLYKRYL
jgi:glycosyltransferase involved in cell wall biosynthesis